MNQKISSTHNSFIRVVIHLHTLFSTIHCWMSRYFYSYNIKHSHIISITRLPTVRWWGFQKSDRLIIPYALSLTGQSIVLPIGSSIYIYDFKFITTTIKIIILKLCMLPFVIEPMQLTFFILSLILQLEKNSKQYFHQHQNYYWKHLCNYHEYERVSSFEI